MAWPLSCSIFMLENRGLLVQVERLPLASREMLVGATRHLGAILEQLTCQLASTHGEKQMGDQKSRLGDWDKGRRSARLQAVMVYASRSRGVYGAGSWMATLLLGVAGIGSCCMA